MVYDVVIAGGRPVGLFLSCELQLAGMSVLVLERMEDHRSPLKAGWMGMRSMEIPSVEAFYRRGLLKDVRECALGWMNADTRAGLELRGTEAPGSAPAPALAGTSPASCWTWQRLTSPTGSMSFPDLLPPAA